MFPLPFRFCDNDFMRKNVKHNSMCLKSLMSYTSSLTPFFEKVNSHRLPYRFEITFYGCVGGDTHYVSVFTVFRANNSNGYERFLLACSPIKIKDYLNPSEHC